MASCKKDNDTIDLKFNVGSDVVSSSVFNRQTNQYEVREFVETKVTNPGELLNFEREIRTTGTLSSCDRVTVVGWVDAVSERE
jgi:hypothetical protein